MCPVDFTVSVFYHIPMSDCPICSRLRPCETSFYKYAAPEYDRPLPEAAARLIVLPAAPAEDIDRHHIRRCPHCAALYDYRFSYEYLVNGSEDEEILTRLDSDQAKSWRLAQAQELEMLRRSIDDLYSSAGSLGDYIDRGRPSEQERRQAYDDMERCRQEAERQRAVLEQRVESLRRDAPEILQLWSDAHVRACQFFLDTLPETSEDARTARYVALTGQQAWQQFPGAGPDFISIDSAWLSDYFDHLKI